MINEVVEVNDYLSGKNISKKNLYRVCYMLAKHFKEQGKTHVEIRQAIFDWGKQYSIFITYNLNNIIYQALDDKQRLKDNVIIKINEKDIQEINNRFDSKNTKIVALAILCFAKTYADRDKEFNISSVALSSWLNINDGNLRAIYLKEIIDFGYITKVEVPKNNYLWNNKGKSKFCRYKINVDIHNSGLYQLQDNNIIDLYNRIFC